MKFNQLAAAALVALMALPLTGCPMYPSMPPYTPGPYPYEPPADRLNGPSLTDAYHDVEKWLGSHYPNARLMSVEGPAVGRSGRSGGKGWTFKYAVESAGQIEPQPYPNPYPVYTPAPGPIPTAMPTAQPKYVLEPGEEYGPPIGTDPVVVNQAAGLVYYNDDQPQILPVRKMPPKATPAPRKPNPRPVMPGNPVRYMSITVDGSGRLLAPEDLPGGNVSYPEPAYGQTIGVGSIAHAYEPAPDDPTFLGDRISFMPVPAPAPLALDFKRTVSLVKLLGAVEDLGNPISPAGVKVSIRPDAGRGAVVEIDPQVAVRDATPAGYPGSVGYGPESSDGPYAATANRKPAYGVKCVAAPGYPSPYETGTDGVLYRGTFLFNAYTGELLSRPARI